MGIYVCERLIGFLTEINEVGKLHAFTLSMQQSFGQSVIPRSYHDIKFQGQSYPYQEHVVISHQKMRRKRMKSRCAIKTGLEVLDLTTACFMEIGRSQARSKYMTGLLVHMYHIMSVSWLFLLSFISAFLYCVSVCCTAL